MTRLKYIASFQKGRIPNELFSVGGNSRVPYLTMDYLRGRTDTPEFAESDQVSVIACDGDIILLWDGSNAGEFIRAKSGAVSSTSAVTRYKGVNGSYFFYLCKSLEQAIRAETVGMGVPHVNGEYIANLTFELPSAEDQQKIADFLDYETTLLDTLIAAKENHLALIAEKRNALITNAVTHGINSKVRLKKSGISWLGAVPEHWKVTRAKNLFREIDLRSSTGEETLLSLRMQQGLVPHNDVSEKLIPSEELIGYKIAEPNQIVVNRMRAASGLIAIVPQPGIVSPDYAVYEPKDEVKPEYYTHLFTTPLLQAVFRSESKGLGTGSSGFLRLYSDNFLSISMPKPPTVEQSAITEYIQSETNKLDALKAATERTITLLVERRSALIASAVTGC